MTTCKHCGGEITNKFLKDVCMPCLEKAMDNLTAADIADAMTDLVGKIEAEAQLETR